MASYFTLRWRAILPRFAGNKVIYLSIDHYYHHTILHLTSSLNDDKMKEVVQRRYYKPYKMIAY